MSVDISKNIYVLYPYDFEDIGWLEKGSKVEFHKREGLGIGSNTKEEEEVHNLLSSLVHYDVFNYDFIFIC